jgi:hypothetical protein
MGSCKLYVEITIAVRAKFENLAIIAIVIST